MIAFKNIEIQDKLIIDAFLKEYQPTTSELTFTNLFMWSDHHHHQYSIIEGVLWLRAEIDGERFMYPPIPGKDGDLSASLALVKESLSKDGLPLILRRADRRTLDLFNDQSIRWELDEDNSDYVYRSSDLIHLEGKKYHGKRNHIRQFEKMAGEYQYLPLNQDLINGCLSFQEKWCQKRECHRDPSLLCEQHAIFKALEHFDQLDYEGGAILVDGQVQAFTLGEKLNTDTTVIHIEKASPDYHGLYTVINQKFCEARWGAVPFINREQDLGVPGLRKAKESYYPDHKEEKFTIWLS